MEGGPLGGNVNSIGSTFSTRYFHPNFHRRNVIAMKFSTATITGYGGKDAPPYNKFYLGGENDIRGYYLYTVSPFVVLPFQTTTPVVYLDPLHLNPLGQPTATTISVPTLEFIPTRPGGDLQAVSNIEYRIPIAGPVELDLFNDAGINGILRSSELNLDPAAVSQLHQQFPGVSSHPPIIGGTNFRPHTSAGVQLVVQLPIIGAPVRIYYAYNYLRVNHAILPPLGEYPCPESAAVRVQLRALSGPCRRAFSGTQVQPNLNQILLSNQAGQRIPASLLEPKHTLNFTVSRTF